MRTKWTILLLLLGLMYVPWHSTRGQGAGEGVDPFAPPDVGGGRWNSRPSDDRPTEAYLRTLSGGYTRVNKSKHENDFKTADGSSRTLASPRIGAAPAAEAEPIVLPFSLRTMAVVAGCIALAASVAAAIVLITYFWRRRRAEMDEPPPMIIAIHSRRPRVRPAPHSDEDTRPLRRAA